MKIFDIAMHMPKSFFMMIAKIPRMDLDEKVKDEIINNGLYHITQNDDLANKILESGYLKPSSGLMKNINSYGTAAVCMFDGTPSVDNFMKNLGTLDLDTNPYLNPTMVSTAVKIQPTEKSELQNYKIREFSDNAIIYEGYCVLPQEKTSIVKLVPDLVRDENGIPIKNEKTGRFDLSFREADPKEIDQTGKHYNPREDYLNFIEQERQRLGYLKRNILTAPINKANFIIHASKVEGDMAIDSTKNAFKRMFTAFKERMENLNKPKLEESIENHLEHDTAKFDTRTKNPYRDSVFSKAVASFAKEGLTQVKFQNELEAITTSDIGKYYKLKEKQIDKSKFLRSKTHGESHSDRVGILSMMIANNENMLKNDENNKTKDYLLTAAYYHDIGRKKALGIELNSGPHAKNSVRKLKKMDLHFVDGTPYSEEDRNIVLAIVEAHEDKDSNMDKLCEKYEIKAEKMEYVKGLMSVIKDADALDRVRLDTNLVGYKVNLNPNYLRTDSSKRLLESAYTLENLTNHYSIDRILSYKSQMLGKDKKKTFDEKCLYKLKEGSEKAIAKAYEKGKEKNNKNKNEIDGIGEK